MHQSWNHINNSSRTPLCRAAYRSIWLLVTLSISACGGGGSSDDTSDDAASITAVEAASENTSENPLAFLDNNHIMTALYTNVRTPDDFYTETSPPPDTFQTIRHIKNNDVPTLPVVATQYELCSNDFSEALSWSDSLGDGDLVDNRDHAIFFEFTRVHLSSPETTTLHRVYKCDHVNRNTVDLLNPSSHLGQYTQTPQQASSIKTLLEYFWRFTISNNYGNAILGSVTIEQTDRYQHTFYQATLSSTNNSQCDAIDVYRIEYLISKADGTISKNQKSHSSFSAINNGGSYEICQ